MSKRNGFIFHVATQEYAAYVNDKQVACIAKVMASDPAALQMWLSVTTAMLAKTLTPAEFVQFAARFDQ